MRNRKYFIMLILSGIIIISCVITACNSKENVDSDQLPENLTSDGRTLLERMYADIDNDSNNESIELYTSAEIAPDGLMGWDTGHQWVLLVRKGEEIFTLFDDWVQHGELQFWVVYFNEDKIEGPESTDLKKQIYVMVSTGVNMKLLSYYWDEQNLCYKQEVVFDPPNQWFTRHSNKYNIPDPAKIESEENAKNPH